MGEREAPRGGAPGSLFASNAREHRRRKTLLEAAPMRADSEIEDALASVSLS